jgi:hypothetical protein
MGPSASMMILFNLTPRDRQRCRGVASGYWGAPVVAGHEERWLLLTESGGRQPTFVAARNCYWITSSAVATRISGMVRPSAFAILRLMASANLVGRTTGRSAGFSPLRMRPA